MIEHFETVEILLLIMLLIKISRRNAHQRIKNSFEHYV